MGIKSLFVASSVPVLEVLIVTAVGSFLAIGRVGLLDQNARKHMNNELRSQAEASLARYSIRGGMLEPNMY